MKKVVFLIAIAVSIASCRQENEKIYTSLEEALQEPEKVYILDLSGSELYNTNNTILLESLTELTNLKTLGLYNLNLTELPENIGEMKKLENLFLYGNDFNEFPEVLKNLKTLKYLDIGTNNIDVIPDWIDQMESLEELEMSQNRQFDSNQSGSLKISPSLANLKRLRSLNLAKTNLRAIPAWFSNIRSLKHLNIDSNSLSSLPKGIAKMQLENLQMYETTFSDFPYFIFDMKSLDSLEIVHDDYQFEFPKKINAPLKYLYIGFKSRLEEFPEAITLLDELESLSLYRLPLDTLPISIVNLTSLKKLYIEKSRVSILPENIGELKKFELFQARFTNIQSLPKSFSKLSSLKKFVCSSCGLTELPNEIGELKSLEYIRINGSHFPKLPKSFGKLKGLRELYFESNQTLTSLPESFANLINLEVLEIYDYNLKETIPGIEGLTRLKQVSLSSSGLSEKQIDQIKELLPPNCNYN